MKIINISGVPTVRIAKTTNGWVVQMLSEQVWEAVSDPFETEEAALDAAPIICEF